MTIPLLRRELARRRQMPTCCSGSASMRCESGQPIALRGISHFAALSHSLRRVKSRLVQTLVPETVGSVSAIASQQPRACSAD